MADITCFKSVDDFCMCEKLRGSLVWRYAKNAAQIQKKPADRLCNISFGGDGRCMDASGVRRMRQRLG